MPSAKQSLPSLKNECAAAAKVSDRTSAQLLREFMREFMQQQEAAEQEAWFRRQVQVGLDSADAGRLVPAAEVEARFAVRRAATRAGLKRQNDGTALAPPKPSGTAKRSMNPCPPQRPT